MPENMTSAEILRSFNQRAGKIDNSLRRLIISAKAIKHRLGETVVTLQLWAMREIFVLLFIVCLKHQRLMCKTIPKSIIGDL